MSARRLHFAILSAFRRALCLFYWKRGRVISRQRDPSRPGPAPGTAARTLIYHSHYSDLLETYSMSIQLDTNLHFTTFGAISHLKLCISGGCESWLVPVAVIPFDRLTATSPFIFYTNGNCWTWQMIVTRRLSPNAPRKALSLINFIKAGEFAAKRIKSQISTGRTANIDCLGYCWIIGAC
jgi:hypothetical protein